jgi:uncharacterized protein (TIGR01244 family)
MSSPRGRLVVGLAMTCVMTARLSAEVPPTADATAFPNYRVLRPGLAVAGKPSAEGLAQLKAMGFKTVVDLRTEKEGTKDEEAVVKAAGLAYVSIPVTAETLSQADADAVGRVLDDPRAGPVLLHCASANRVGAVWALLRIGQGKTLEEAEAEGRTIGLKSPALVEAMRKVAAPARP